MPVQSFGTKIVTMYGIHSLASRTLNEPVSFISLPKKAKKLAISTQISENDTHTHGTVIFSFRDVLIGIFHEPPHLLLSLALGQAVWRQAAPSPVHPGCRSHRSNRWDGRQHERWWGRHRTAWGHWGCLSAGVAGTSDGSWNVTCIQRWVRGTPYNS